ncbi:hypothetical protein [Frondihabitans sp. 762G35]|uniref:hypothetical protein n=1 Tax=Frondihabitans sp. 762G35 TaxID=1446794 RepID=UPI000E706E12|nr:hypothetical protein [Frondihabitans sp. 762G35]
MENRFRIDGHDLEVDARRSVVNVDVDGVLDATIAARRIPGEVSHWATVAPRLHFARVPLRFDGERLGATVDQEFLDSLLLEDGGVTFALSSRFDAFGTLTSHAGDRIRFTGRVETPWSDEPWRLDVACGFGGRRRAEI